MVSLLAHRKRSGLTFVELIVVTLLIALLSTFAVVKLDTATPRTLLSSEARKIGGQVIDMRARAIASGLTNQLIYDLDSEPSKLLIRYPVLEADGERIPVWEAEWEEIEYEELDKNVRITEVKIGDARINSGRAVVNFEPSGLSDFHFVVIEHIEKEIKITIKINALTGIVQYYKGYHDFEMVRDSY